MKKIGIYPGTFDPITNGHVDVIKRSLKIVDRLIVAISSAHSKDYLFSEEERVSIVKKSLFKDIKIKPKSVKILSRIFWAHFLNDFEKWEHWNFLLWVILFGK